MYVYLYITTVVYPSYKMFDLFYYTLSSSCCISILPTGGECDILLHNVKVLEASGPLCSQIRHVGLEPNGTFALPPQHIDRTPIYAILYVIYLCSGYPKLAGRSIQRIKGKMLSTTLSAWSQERELMNIVLSLSETFIQPRMRLISCTTYTMFLIIGFSWRSICTLEKY